MIDVRIVHSAARETTVRQLEEALAHVGYRAAATRTGVGEAPPATDDASALLFLWDRSSINLPPMRTAAAAARRVGRAIDVSADGITPLDLDDDRGVIRLSAWRGEPSHPGWTRILAEVGRLCGERKGSRAPLAAAEPAEVSAGAKEVGATRGTAGLPARPLAILGVVLLVLVVAVAALSWRSRPDMTPQAPTKPPAAPTRAAALPPRPASAPPAPAAAPSVPAVNPEPAPLAAAAALDQPIEPPAAPAAARKAKPVRGRHARPARAEPTPHYTRYAGIMRLFCRRSGRGTPECKVFERAFRSRR